jgi:hypothetical protein
MQQITGGVLRKYWYILDVCRVPLHDIIDHSLTSLLLFTIECRIKI